MYVSIPNWLHNFNVLYFKNGQQHSGICDSRGHCVRGYFSQGENGLYSQGEREEKTGAETEGGKSGTILCRPKGPTEKHKDPAKERGQAWIFLPTSPPNHPLTCLYWIYQCHFPLLCPTLQLQQLHQLMPRMQYIAVSADGKSHFIVFSFFSVGIKSAWAGNNSHVLVSKVGPYKLFYQDILQIGPGKELESEVYILVMFVCLFVCQIRLSCSL